MEELKIAKRKDFKEKAPEEKFPLQGSFLELSKFEANEQKHGNAREYTNLFDFFDAIPKFFFGPVNRTSDGTLKPFKAKFVSNKKEYWVVVHPAYVEQMNDDFKHYYPGFREQLITTALLKMASHGAGLYLQDKEGSERFGVEFTLRGLQKELKGLGHTYSTSEIKEALIILATATISVRTSHNGKIVEIYGIKILETLGLVTLDDWQNMKGNVKAFVRFNTIIDSAIENFEFRIAEYQTLMSHKSALDFNIHMKLERGYSYAGFVNVNKRIEKEGQRLTQAGMHPIQIITELQKEKVRLDKWKEKEEQPFPIWVRTLIDERIMSEYSSISNNVRDIEKSLSRLKEKGIVDRWEKKIVKEGRKIINACLLVYGSEHFKYAKISSNFRFKKGRQALSIN